MEPSNYTFGAALAFMQKGDHVARATWNGKNMFLFYAVGGSATHGLDRSFVDLGPFIVIHDAQGINTPWLASQADMLASDWFVL